MRFAFVEEHRRHIPVERVTQKFSYWVIAMVTLCIDSSVIDQSNAATKKLLSARQPRI